LKTISDQANEIATGVVGATSTQTLQADAAQVTQLADNGAVQTRLDTAASAATASQTALQQSITNVAGADLTQTLVQLTQANNSYQAGLQSASAILQLQQSLLAYLP
jgi:flagellin-like hook-associated protein FlgL